MTAPPTLTAYNLSLFQAALEALPADEAQATYIRLVARLYPSLSLQCLADLHQAANQKDHMRLFRALSLLREAATALEAQRLITLCQRLDYRLSTRYDWAEARAIVYEIEAENYGVLEHLSLEAGHEHCGL